MSCVFFFCQAEDGIRDLVRSRGLGDVYKRQVAASEETLTVRVRSGEEHTIGRTNLEKAVQKVQAGAVLKGPKDYRDLIADDRPAYAWAILRELGYIK